MLKNLYKRSEDLFRLAVARFGTTAQINASTEAYQDEILHDTDKKTLVVVGAENEKTWLQREGFMNGIPLKDYPLVTEEDATRYVLAFIKDVDAGRALDWVDMDLATGLLSQALETYKAVANGRLESLETNRTVSSARITELEARPNFELTNTYENLIDKAASASTVYDLLQSINAIQLLLSSPDTSLDDLKEIVSFIKINRSTLDALTIASIAGLQDALDNAGGSIALQNNGAEVQAKADTLNFMGDLSVDNQGNVLYAPKGPIGEGLFNIDLDLTPPFSVDGTENPSGTTVGVMSSAPSQAGTGYVSALYDSVIPMNRYFTITTTNATGNNGFFASLSPSIAEVTTALSEVPSGDFGSVGVVIGMASALGIIGKVAGSDAHISPPVGSVLATTEVGIETNSQGVFVLFLDPETSLYVKTQVSDITDSLYLGAFIETRSDATDDFSFTLNANPSVMPSNLDPAVSALGLGNPVSVVPLSIEERVESLESKPAGGDTGHSGSLTNFSAPMTPASLEPNTNIENVKTGLTLDAEYAFSGVVTGFDITPASQWGSFIPKNSYFEFVLPRDTVDPYHIITFSDSSDQEGLWRNVGKTKGAWINSFVGGSGSGMYYFGDSLSGNSPASVEGEAPFTDITIGVECNPLGIFLHLPSAGKPRVQVSELTDNIVMSMLLASGSNVPTTIRGTVNPNATLPTTVRAGVRKLSDVPTSELVRFTGIPKVVKSGLYHDLIAAPEPMSDIELAAGVSKIPRTVTAEQLAVSGFDPKKRRLIWQGSGASITINLEHELYLVHLRSSGSTWVVQYFHSIAADYVTSSADLLSQVSVRYYNNKLWGWKDGSPMDIFRIEKIG